jgi:hypothetical protein
MSPDQRQRLKDIPGALKRLSDEAKSILESDGYLASASQWQSDMFSSIAKLAAVIREATGDSTLSI